MTSNTSTIIKGNDIQQPGNFHHKSKNKILGLISGGDENLVIKALDGSMTLAKASRTLFKWDITWWLWEGWVNAPSDPTPKISVAVYGLNEPGANTLQMFRSLSADFSLISLSQAQIVEFCTAHSAWLGREEGKLNRTFFLCKMNGTFFPVTVHVYSYHKSQLEVVASSFKNEAFYFGEHGHRLVVPKSSI